MSEPLQENTTLRTALVALILVIIGGLILLLANHLAASDPPPDVVVAFLNSIGSLLVSAASLAMLWELATKRAFARELEQLWATRLTSGLAAKLLEQFRGHEALRQAGLADYTMHFSHGIKWNELFVGSKEADFFFSYARSWRHTHEPEIIRFAQGKGNRLRVFLPNPENAQIVANLAYRYQASNAEIADRIRQAKDDFAQWFKGKDGTVEVYFVDHEPVFTFYRFDGTLILPLFKHRPGRSDIPVFVAQRGGDLYAFAESEIQHFLDDGVKVHPPPPPPPPAAPTSTP